MEKNAHIQLLYLFSWTLHFCFGFFFLRHGHVAIFIFLGCGCDSCFVLFFFCLTRHDFYFLINWVIASFFFFLIMFVIFFVLIGHHFLTRVYE